MTRPQRRFWRRWGLPLLALAMSGACTASPPVMPSLACSNTAFTVRLQQAAADAPSGAHLVVAPSVPPQAVVVIEENGEDLEAQFDDQAAFAPIDLRPPRFGVVARTLGDAHSIMLRSVRARAATARVGLYCGPADEAHELVGCVQHPGDASAAGEGAWCTAIRRHNQAFASSRKSDFVAALALYLAAADAWKARGDAARAGAALLGATEALMNLGRYGDVAAVARQSSALSARAGSDYFALRARGEACLAVRDMGERPAARRCLVELPAAFLALGEHADAANADYNLGSMADEDGDWQVAEHWLRAARAIDLTGAPPEIAGRLDVLAASLDVAGGRLASAMANLDAAAVVFTTTHNERWLGNVDLRLARLYAHMAAWDESRIFAADALVHLPESQAPKRRAEAFRIMSVADAELNAAPRARAEVAEARRLIGDNAPAAQRALDLDEALLLGDDDALGRAQAAPVAGTSRSDFESARLALARARRALREGHVDDAANLVALVHAQNLNVADYLLWAETRAHVLAGAGRGDKAMALIENEVAQLRARAERTSGSGLRYLAGQRLLDLRRVWIDLYLAQPAPARPDVGRVWRLIVDTEPERLLVSVGPAAGAPDAINVDHALAEALLQDPGDLFADAALRSQRALVHYYGALAPTAPARLAAAPASLASVQAALPVHTQLLAFAFGTQAGIAVSMTSETATTRVIAAPADVRASAAALLTSAASNAASVDAIASAARALSEQLLRGESSTTPQRLWVLPDPALNGVPFALLVWPGQTSWLDETTSSSIVLAPSPANAHRGRPTHIDVFAAGDVAGGLAPLPGASRERAWIAQSLPQTTVVPLALDNGARDALLGKLRTPGAWLHMAAHGTTQPMLHSYSGIWMPAANGAPEFFSWLDVTARPATADLVVLDACELASGDPHASERAAAFATALSAAGVHDVVGALWPVSDAAAALWVPAFYGALQDDDPPPDTADAVRAARTRLRTSRAFQHPFYWASLVHLRH